MPAATDPYIHRSRMPVSAAELFAWHTRPAAFMRLPPPWEPVQVTRKVGPFGNGHRVMLRVPLLGPCRVNWTAWVHDLEPGRRFADLQTHGPFTYWDHTHTMTPDGPDASHLEEHVVFRPPLGALGEMLTDSMIRDRLRRMFTYRHAVTASDLTRHAQFRSRPRLTVAITGSNGLVGTDLCHFLTTGGHAVRRMVRGTPRPAPFDDGTTSVPWDPSRPIDLRTLQGVDAVVHLAGENIAERRWSDSQKRRIRDSRSGPTRHLAEALARLEPRPRVLVSASAIGIYGDRADEWLSETASPGTGFLAEVCREWEAATEPAAAAGIRVVNLRIGIVLTPRGAALGSQLLPFQMGAGAMLGSGRQWISWITLNDLLGVIHHALFTDTLVGPVNAVAPNPETNRLFGRTLARVLRRPYLATLPAGVLRLMFGEVADGALLASMRVTPQKLTASGFQFDHPDLEPALRFMLGR